MTTTDPDLYPRVKAYERAEFDRLAKYLAALDAGGWVEQSYCADWPVYQVVSHLGSGSRIGAMRLQGWMRGAGRVTRDAMQAVWAHFDSLQPDQMLAAYLPAAAEYLAAEAGTPDTAAFQEVEGYAGSRPLWAYQVGRVAEIGLHAWDVYVARDRSARLDSAAVALLAPHLEYTFVAMDPDRAAGLQTMPVIFRLSDSGHAYALDLSGQRPAVAQTSDVDAPLIVEGPDEEMIRFIAGRDVVPGATPHLRAAKGTAQDLANLRRAFR